MTNPAKKPYNKKWLSVSDQVSLLESRSLIVKDRATAEEFLGYANYYRFSGDCLAFQDKPDHFRSGTEFDHDGPPFVVRPKRMCSPWSIVGTS